MAKHATDAARRRRLNYYIAIPNYLVPKKKPLMLPPRLPNLILLLLSSTTITSGASFQLFSPQRYRRQQQRRLTAGSSIIISSSISKRRIHNYEPRIRISPPSPPLEGWGGAAPSTTALRASSPSPSPPPQFQVGEEVMVIVAKDGKGGAQEPRVIGSVEEKKGGWYTIRLKRDSTRVKRRGSQLLLREEGSDEEGGSNLRDDANPQRSPSNMAGFAGSGDGPSSEETAASIVDLDSILQSARRQERSDQHAATRGPPFDDGSGTVSTDTIRQVATCHSKIERWLIFSDLHVMPSTLSTCLEVLGTVHDAALRRGSCGILFLGDFWHHRGFVRVDCLNAVLEAMSRWTVPCVLMPGNHDQVDWVGAEHALTPLANSYRILAAPAPLDGGGGDGGGRRNDIREGTTSYHAGPLILSRPTKFMNALFVPHIRDKSTMRAILSSREARRSSALFVHADVRGASMNDMIKSQHGISAGTFPSDKRVYSGHFHKPHVVRTGGSGGDDDGVSIRYVGSPYQTSLAEAGQVKSLLVVDSSRGWECVEEVPIDVGRRYHRVSSVRRFLEFGGGPNDDGGLSMDSFRKGDKVAVTVCQLELEEARRSFADDDTGSAAAVGGTKSPFDAKLEELRDMGIAVEIRDARSDDSDGDEEGLVGTGETSSSSTTSDDDGEEGGVELEDLSPEAVLAAYLDEEIASGELGEATAKTLLEVGGEILRRSADAPSPNRSRNGGDAATSVSELELESVSLLGFGSFRKEAIYPLKDRGVVLLRGTNKDFGSDSNGVGKSTLAMASLWALAGSTDPRPTQDGKVTDVINDFSKIAEVTLCGRINSTPFVVKRTKGTRTSSLTFILDGSDLTRQSSKDTQALINEYFGIESSQILTRTIFHGQHAVGGLLESSDARLKEELSNLVSLEVWRQSASLARSTQREKLKRAAELEGMLSLRKEDTTRAQEKCRMVKEEMTRRTKVLEDERRTLSQKEHSSSINPGAADIEKNMDEVQAQLHECDAKTTGLEEELEKFTSSDNEEIMLLQSKLNDKVAIENESRSKLQACQRNHDIMMMELKNAERRLDHVRSEWNVITSGSVKDNSSSFSSPPKTCNTCGQPIVSSAAQKHVMENIEEKLTAATFHIDEAKEAVSVASLARTVAEEDADAKGLEVRSCVKRLRAAEETLSLETEGLRTLIKEARLVRSELSAKFAGLTRKTKVISESNLVKSRAEANLIRLEEALDSSVAAYEGRHSELEMIEGSIAGLEIEREAAASSASLHASLADAFGPRGVQAFVLRRIVQALQHRSKGYLDELSDGSLQLRMHVGSNDSIVKQAAVRNLDGTWRVRALSTLSGGQWRRCSLSTSLGFIDLASRRGRLRSSLLVLDEPLTHLDSVGRKSVGKLLRKMLSREESSIGENHRRGWSHSGLLSLSTILVILQEIAAEEIEECFDQIDEVVKHGGESFIVLDENQEE